MNKGMEKKVYRILALNFGSTSSKLAYFENLSLIHISEPTRP